MDSTFSGRIAVGAPPFGWLAGSESSQGDAFKDEHGEGGSGANANANAKLLLHRIRGGRHFVRRRKASCSPLNNQ